MIARELISTTIPVLHPNDAGTEALRLMNEFHVTQLPLVVEDKYAALIDEDTVLDWEDPDILLEAAPYGNLKPAIPEQAHHLEALKLFYEFKLSVLPVVSKDNDYLGLISKDTLLAALAQFNAVKDPGGLIALDLDPRDYSLSEIARIAESNDVSLLSVQTITDPQTGRLEVLLKTNRLDLQALVATFERFNYTIKYLFSEAQEEDLVKKNYDLLMNYISM
ncbi:CBS domain-containing protein [Chitinophaga jiangningensis]|uniref:CBS domain-containing protein n=1 Tax=Chitinophaga jiangningensis TaxID=1419482 RepID=A0A1M7HMK4_9BACT|nr:CBS domain-containing protein [Chitinophaga jiangningensis]SHM29563.1 CBS domain-containing protein [Chitinophaga jiangningensis]